MHHSSLNDYLLSLKVYPNNKGYHCVKQCVAVLKAQKYTKISDAYKTVSEILGLSPKAVEQNIIYAIENAWLKADAEFLRTEFGSTILESKCKPTCKQFLLTLSEKKFD